MTDDAVTSRSAVGARHRDTFPRHIIFDCIVILVISLVAEGVAFTPRNGRASVCADSYQYIAAADALLGAEHTPHFEMRKPGYPIFLAGVKLAFDRLGWVAIVCNHVLLAFLPLAAYGFGRHLHSRLLGWSAAALVIVQLQGIHFGNWMMSEALYVFLLSFGLLALFVGLRKPRAVIWLSLAGLLLGAAWLTRGAATAVIVVALGAVVVVHRRDHRRALTLCTALGLPLLGAFVFECSLNHAFAGRFRPSTGSAALGMWAYRVRAFQGMDIPDTPEAKRLVALLPERSPDDAYISDGMDGWVARYHALRDHGLDDWELESLCRKASFAAIRADPASYLAWSAKLVMWHVLRRGDAFSLSPVPESTLRGRLAHPDLPPAKRYARHVYAYWSLPHLPFDQSGQLVDRIREEAGRRTPHRLENYGIIKAGRYWKTKPAVAGVLEGLTWLGKVWPGFALLLCGLLGVNRTTCCILAIIYVVEAVLLSNVTVTEARFQSVWLVTDTALAAALPTVLVAGLVRRVRTRILSRWPSFTEACPANAS